MYRPLLKSHPHAVQTYKATDITSIYKFPPPTNLPITVSVISLGGGLFGDVSPSGQVTNGDVQAYWTSIGISPQNQPKVFLFLIDGATNSPVSGQGETSENTLDVSMVGGCCPTSNLTILLYIGPNSLSEFTNLITRATSPVTINGTVYTPSVLSCSWGAAEVYYTPDQLTTINALLNSVTKSGINICAATGDNGSSDGVAGTLSYVDFPSSSPYVTACGGTTLICPTLNYSDPTTKETAWTDGGGGISGTFAKPAWQIPIPGATGPKRCSPDIAMNADPSTGVEFIIGGHTVIYGGTSVVAPAMAAFYACLNSNRFLLPSIYAAAQAQPTTFNDILLGSNGAYTAQKGFDLCTGFGSLVGTTLALQLQTLPPPTPIPVTGVTLSQTTLSLLIGSQYQLVAIIAPSNATNKQITWSSTNPAVATVVAMVCPAISMSAPNCGCVTPRICTCESPNIIACGCSGPVVVACGCGAQMANPCGCSDSCKCGCVEGGPCMCASPYVGPCDSVGLITAVQSGTTLITAQTLDGSFTASASITVTAPTVIVPVIGVTLDVSMLILIVGSQRQMVATVSPFNATNKQLIWTSNDAAVTVGNTGLITAISVGNALVTATTVDGGYSATVTVSIVAQTPSVPVTGVSLTIASATLLVKGTKQLVAVVTPTNATNTNLLWTSSDPSVTVTNTGLVKAIKVGTAIITAITVDGGFIATALITAYQTLKGITFNPSSVSLYTHTTYQSNLVFDPVADSILPVTYYSYSPNVASIDTNGLITARNPGKATIKASIFGKTALLYVYVFMNYSLQLSSPIPNRNRSNYSSVQATGFVLPR